MMPGFMSLSSALVELDFKLPIASVGYRNIQSKSSCGRRVR
jgi:hypothetical protein